MQEQAKRPLQIPAAHIDSIKNAAAAAASHTAVSTAVTALEESGDYANQAQIDDLAQKALNKSSAKEELIEKQQQQVRKSRDSFGSDYEEPIIPPSQGTGRF